jgi:hypothetical protein
VRRFGPSLASTSASSGAPPMNMKAPKGPAVFGDPFGIVDSAQVASLWRGGELTRWLGFAQTFFQKTDPVGSFYGDSCSNNL